MIRPWYNYPPEVGIPMLRRLVKQASVRPIALLVALVIALSGLIVAVGPAEAVAPVSVTSQAIMPQAPVAAQTAQSCTWEPDGKCYWYSGYHFGTGNAVALCAQNNIGVYWNIVTADNAFEIPAISIDNRQINVNTSCSASGYAVNRIYTLTTYSDNDGACAKVTGDNNGGQWTQNVVIWMNLTAPSSCNNTLQHRNNTISNAIGLVLGLVPFTSSTNLTAAVMNRYFANSYNYAGYDDRNALYWIY
jgi:hypothetical protein